jgi:hypothetical protein
MTYLMPGMVMDVSATFVARMTFRVFAGAGEKTLAWAEGVVEAMKGQTRTWREENVGEQGEGDDGQFALIAIEHGRERDRGTRRIRVAGQERKEEKGADLLFGVRNLFCYT